MARRSRPIGGVSTVELVTGLIVLVPFFLAMFELAVIVIVAQVSDGAAREAARIAASSDPRFAQQRADAVIAQTNQGSHTMSSQFKMVSFAFTPADTLAQETKLIPYGGSLTGDVTVTVQCTVKPYLISLLTNNKPITFNSMKTCPFTYNVPNTAGGAAIGGP
jgi:TadE-like protein